MRQPWLYFKNNIWVPQYVGVCYQNYCYFFSGGLAPQRLCICQGKRIPWRIICLGLAWQYSGCTLQYLSGLMLHTSRPLTALQVIGMQSSQHLTLIFLAKGHWALMPFRRQIGLWGSIGAALPPRYVPSSWILQCSTFPLLQSWFLFPSGKHHSGTHKLWTCVFDVCGYHTCPTLLSLLPLSTISCLVFMCPYSSSPLRESCITGKGYITGRWD